MNTDRDCGCKGYRSCLYCETRHGFSNHRNNRLFDTFTDLDTSIYCIECNSLHKGWDCFNYECTPSRSIIPQEINGIRIFRDFITKEEENELITNMDRLPWSLSQSGRRKQNFGPKTNFKKRKIKLGNFNGFPDWTRFIIRDRFQFTTNFELLRGYKPVEQCFIEYRKDAGAWIEPHIDDCWIWGERIVQINLLSDSVLTLNKYTTEHDSKYNLRDVTTFPRILSESGDRVLHDPFSNVIGTSTYEFRPFSTRYNIIRVPLPRRSLLVLYGELRYQWEHCILRQDITQDRRIVIAYRELTPPYLPGGSEEDIGRDILKQAESFSG